MKQRVYGALLAAALVLPAHDAFACYFCGGGGCREALCGHGYTDCESTRSCTRADGCSNVCAEGGGTCTVENCATSTPAVARRETPHGSTAASWTGAAPDDASTRTASRP